MNEPSIIEPRSARRFLSGLAFLGGMLALSLIQSLMKMRLVESGWSLLGILAVLALHRWLERDIPRSVDTIASQVARLPEDRRTGLNDYLRGNDLRSKD